MSHWGHASFYKDDKDWWNTTKALAAKPPAPAWDSSIALPSTPKHVICALAQVIVWAFVGYFAAPIRVRQLNRYYAATTWFRRWVLGFGLKNGIVLFAIGT